MDLRGLTECAAEWNSAGTFIRGIRRRLPKTDEVPEVRAVAAPVRDDARSGERASPLC